MSLLKKSKSLKKKSIGSKAKKAETEDAVVKKETAVEETVDYSPEEVIQPTVAKKDSVLNTSDGAVNASDGSAVENAPDAPIRQLPTKGQPSTLNPINAEKDVSLIQARVISPVNAVIGKRRYKLENGKSYKLTHNVYDVLKNAGKVL